MNKLITLLLIVITGFAFSTLQKPLEDPKPVYIPASVQRTGDAKKGYEYLVTGDYLKSGVPYDFFSLALGKDKKNFVSSSNLSPCRSCIQGALKIRNRVLFLHVNPIQTLEKLREHLRLLLSRQSLRQFPIDCGASQDNHLFR